MSNKPLFGLDIGSGSLKVMQLDESSIGPGKPRVIGYGTTKFDPAAVNNGVIIKPEVIAAAMIDLFHGHLIGDITTRRVAMAIPAYRTYTRAINLPALRPKEIREAVLLESEQYIPLPIEELYLDYSVLKSDKESTEVFAVAVPKDIIDSYLDLALLLGLEVVMIETTLGGSARLFGRDTRHDGASVIIDFGSMSCDISIYDDKNILVTGTVRGGGSIFSQSIGEKLNVTPTEATVIKNKYGLGISKKQQEITEALEPTLREIVKEIRRMIRYYDERYGSSRPISQAITLGGGANMPGLTEYLTDALRLPVRHCEPWLYFEHKGLQPPLSIDKPMYSTVAGLSLLRSNEVLAS